MKTISLSLISFLFVAHSCVADTIPPAAIANLFVGSVDAAPVGDAEETVKIEIGTITISSGKVGDTIDVMLAPGSFSVAGFDFKIGSDSR